MQTDYTITGYTLRVAVLYKDCVTFLPSKNTWREMEHVVGPEYGGGRDCLSDEHLRKQAIWNAEACAAVLNRHPKDEHGIPSWNGLRPVGACVIGCGANIKENAK